jgi:hypothetical protein
MNETIFKQEPVPDGCAFEKKHISAMIAVRGPGIKHAF